MALLGGPGDGVGAKVAANQMILDAVRAMGYVPLSKEEWETYRNTGDPVRVRELEAEIMLWKRRHAEAVVEVLEHEKLMRQASERVRVLTDDLLTSNSKLESITQLNDHLQGLLLPAIQPKRGRRMEQAVPELAVAQRRPDPEGARLPSLPAPKPGQTEIPPDLLEDYDEGYLEKLRRPVLEWSCCRCGDLISPFTRLKNNRLAFFVACSNEVACFQRLLTLLPGPEVRVCELCGANGRVAGGLRRSGSGPAAVCFRSAACACRIDRMTDKLYKQRYPYFCARCGAATEGTGRPDPEALCGDCLAEGRGATQG